MMPPGGIGRESASHHLDFLVENVMFLTQKWFRTGLKVLNFHSRCACGLVRDISRWASTDFERYSLCLELWLSKGRPTCMALTKDEG